MGQLDFLLGPMLVGTAVSVFLSGILLVQCYNYFVRFTKDPKWMKMMVWYLLITDLGHAGVEVAICYQYCVTFFGDFQKITFATSLFACIPIFSVSISSVAQCFFAWRVARLTRVMILGWIIAGLAIVQFRKPRIVCMYAPYSDPFQSAESESLSLLLALHLSSSSTSSKESSFPGSPPPSSAISS